jgi:putative transposase
MSALLVPLLAALRAALRSRLELEAEIFALRHQLAVLQRQGPRRPRLRQGDRLLWVLLSRLWPNWRRAVQIVSPETVVRWHRRAFAFAWSWTSRRRRPGRPAVAADLRALIRRMQAANPLWGAPRIHGELRKLGIEIAQTTVAKYLTRYRHPGPSSQTWRTFLANHVSQLASIDFFTVPTVTFRVLFVHVIVWNERALRRHLQQYLASYHQWRTHLSLDKDPPVPRAATIRPLLGVWFASRTSAVCTTITNVAPPDPGSPLRSRLLH